MRWLVRRRRYHQLHPSHERQQITLPNSKFISSFIDERLEEQFFGLPFEERDIMVIKWKRSYFKAKEKGNAREMFVLNGSMEEITFFLSYDVPKSSLIDIKEG